MTPVSIRYVEGDATRPQGTDRHIVAHVCNDLGRWGAGFSGAVTRQLGKGPEGAYRRFARAPTFGLGQVQFTPIAPILTVANMIAQRGIGWENDVPPIRYKHLRTCLELVAKEALLTQASVHMPRIGAGLGGGDWNIIESIIKETLVAQGVTVYVYTLPGTQP